MQRKGTRKPNNANNATNTVTNQAEQQQEVNIEETVETPKKPDITFRELYFNILSGIKILFIFFIVSMDCNNFNQSQRK